MQPCNRHAYDNSNGDFFFPLIGFYLLIDILIDSEVSVDKK